MPPSRVNDRGRPSEHTG